MREQGLFWIMRDFFFNDLRAQRTYWNKCLGRKRGTKITRLKIQSPKEILGGTEYTKVERY